MNVQIMQCPSSEDWAMVRTLALSTAGKDNEGREPSETWKHKALRAEHSMIRYLRWVIRMEGIPYYVSVHLTRHKVGVEHFVRSQRNDRQSNYDRRAMRQDAPVNHIMVINAQALITMANRRLCGKADEATREVMGMVRDAVNTCNPEMKPFLLPMCECRGECREMTPCGRRDAACKPE